MQIPPFPDDVYVEIIRHLSPDQIVQFRMVNSRSKWIVTNTVWAKLSSNPMYLIRGYKFNDYRFTIRSLNSKTSDFDELDQKILVNANKFCTIRIVNATITRELIKLLCRVKKVVFVRCNCPVFVDDDYKLLAEIPTISFKFCDLPFVYFEHLHIHTFQPTYLDKTFLIRDYLRRVDRLHLSRCGIFDSTSLHDLVFVNLVGVNLSLDLDDNFEHVVSNLKYLQLHNCNLIGRSKLDTLRNVKKLHIINSKITNNEFKYFESVESIEVIECNGVTDKVFTMLPKLIRIDTDIKITSEVFKSLPSIQSLCSLTNQTISIKDTQYLTSLTTLDLIGNNSITDDVLSKLTALTKLVLQSAGITGSCFKYLTRIRELSLCFCNKLVFGNLSYLTKLEYFDLESFDFTDIHLPYIKHVKRIHLCCSSLTNDGLVHLANVSELGLVHCGDYTAGGLKHLVNVKKLYIEMSNITQQEFDDANLNSNDWLLY